MQADTPAREYVPAPQFPQVPTPVAPAWMENLPALHGVHVDAMVAPVTPEYVPARQAVQDALEAKPVPVK